MPLSAAERQRRCREKRKANPEKVAEVKQKNLERYHAKKKLVKDMTPREHRLMKRKWQVRNKRRRDKQKAVFNLLQNTPPSTPGLQSPIIDVLNRSVTPSSTASSRGRKHVRRDRTKTYRENIHLKSQITDLQRKIEKYKKRLSRKEKKLREKTDTENKTKYAVLSNAIKDHYNNIKDLKTKRRIQNIFKDETIKKFRMKTQLIKDTLGITRLVKQKTAPPKHTKLELEIRSFFLRDDVSRATAGKKETVTLHKNKMQKRYLLDTMQNLHKTFLKKNPNTKCHCSYFTKKKPFYVVPQSVDSRNTCLCKLHSNMAYITTALHKNKIISLYDLNQIIPLTVCHVDSLACMKGSCSTCKTKTITFNRSNDNKCVELMQWIRTSEVIEKNERKIKISKHIKKTDTITFKELIVKFEEQLKIFKCHVFNIKNQYKAYRKCIDELSETEIVLHIDFSENYACKYHEEIQAHHFGGSRNQVSLHTVVMYSKNENDNTLATSFCTVSPSTEHGPAAIWAHLHPIFDYVESTLPLVKTIHVFSDGPATQYKQKANFYLLATRFFEFYGFENATWNYFESGHGKGAADGVGGSLKRVADNLVANGHDITDALQFYSALKDRTKSKLFFVSKDDICLVACTIPTGLFPLKGTIQVHQMFAQNIGILHYRSLSCFCRKFCSCYNLKTYHPLPKEQQKTPEDESREGPDDNLDLCIDINVLGDVTNLITSQRLSIYDTIYSPCSTSDEDEPLINIKRQTPGTSNEIKLTENEIHPTLIQKGTHVLVRVLSEKKYEYRYLAMAKGDVDEEGDVQIVFYKTAGYCGKQFRLVETDVSDVSFDNLIKIVPAPKLVKQGRRVLYVYDEPLDIFEM